MRPFQDGDRLRAFVTDHPSRAAYVEAFAFAAFVRVSRYTSGYAADPRWCDAIFLTEEAEEVLEKARAIGLSAPRADILMAALGCLYHHDFFVNVDKSDFGLVRTLVQEDLGTFRARLPYRYGRILYDRFNELHPTGSVRVLSADQTQALLADTPQGVYQIGYTLTGPLGVLTSQTMRYAPPGPFALWHSRDKGSTEPHSAGFQPPEISIVEAYDAIDRAAHMLGGPPSHWREALADISRCEKGGSDSLFRGMHWLIAECVVPEERTAFVAYVLDSAHGKQLREVIASPPRKRASAQGPSGTVAGRLSPEEQLQLLLVLPDVVLVRLLDEACRNRAVRPSEFEVRNAIGKFDFFRMMDDPDQPALQFGVLGVRANHVNETARLAMTLLHAFARANATEDLMWKVRAKSGTTLSGEVLDFIRKEGPVATIQKLALASRPVLDAVLAELLIPYGDGIERRLVKEILWKCGFEVPEHDLTLERLRERLGAFKQVVLSSGDVDSEESRERLRSAGVNLFVSVEEFLENLVAYNVWVLSANLYADEDFRYSHSDGLRAVVGVLSDLEIPEETAAWDPGGKNTLGTLLAYLAAAGKWIGRELTPEARDSLRRPEADLPDHREYGCGRRYALAYRAMWANCDQESLDLFRRRFVEMASLVARSDVAGVRNGLDHKRAAGAFPTVDRLSGFMLYFERAIELAQAHRLYPKEFFLDRRIYDRHGAVEYQLTDLHGARVEILEPAVVIGLRRHEILTFDHSILVAPEGILGGPRQLLCLKKVRESAYMDYWAGYPRIRQVAPDEETASASVGFEKEVKA